jgi:polar amino acid transport system substrate-binding protein
MKSFLVIIASVLLSLIATNLFSQKDGDSSNSQSVYNRVMESGTLRCGYLPSKGFLDIDPNTGEKSGIVFDYMTQLTKNLGLKLEWTEEVGRGDYVAALQSDRFDAYCTAISVNAERAREVDFTDPYAYDRFDIFVKNGNKKFDYKLSSLNVPSVKFVVIEGDIFEKITRKFFPQAELVILPQLTSEAEQFVYVETGKADAVISTPMIFDGYADNNSNKLRQVELGRPFIFSNTSISIKRGEYELRRMIDLATIEMHSNGQLESILDKHNPQKLIGRRILPFTAEGK